MTEAELLDLAVLLTSELYGTLGQATQQAQLGRILALLREWDRETRRLRAKRTPLGATA